MPFEQTPLFQLNLMIWLSWPAVSKNVIPIFYQDGYRLYRIGPSITVSPAHRPRFATLPMPVKRSAAPDLLLRNAKSQTLMPLECKVSSFGPDTEQAGQASGLLSLTGQYLADYFGLPQADDWSAFLLYALCDGQQDRMCDTLEELSAHLQRLEIDVVPSGSIGIQVTDTGVYLRPEPRSVIPVPSLRHQLEHAVLVMELEPGDDPYPLYVIPLDPSVDAHDEHGHRVLEERVRSALTSLIGSRLDAPKLEITLDEVLRVAIEVWDIWDETMAKQGLRNSIKVYLRTTLQVLRKAGLRVNVVHNRVTIVGITPARAKTIRKFLKSVAWRKGEVDLRSEAVQMDFSDLAEGW
jgi:hypothetical protein